MRWLHVSANNSCRAKCRPWILSAWSNGQPRRLEKSGIQQFSFRRKEQADELENIQLQQKGTWQGQFNSGLESCFTCCVKHVNNKRCKRLQVALRNKVPLDRLCYSRQLSEWFPQTWIWECWKYQHFPLSLSLSLSVSLVHLDIIKRFRQQTIGALGWNHAEVSTKQCEAKITRPLRSHKARTKADITNDCNCILSHKVI